MNFRLSWPVARWLSIVMPMGGIGTHGGRKQLQHHVRLHLIEQMIWQCPDFLRRAKEVYSVLGEVRSSRYAWRTVRTLLRPIQAKCLVRQLIVAAKPQEAGRNSLMTVVGLLRKWLVATPIAGRNAWIIGLAAVGLPTLYRVSLNGLVTGIGYCPYLPFVLLSALLLGWRKAALIALTSVAVVDFLFVGPRFQLVEGPTDMLGDLGFLVISALIISLVYAIRTAFEDLVGRAGTHGVFFSLEDGQAWASWPTAGFHLRLGPQDDVVEMMKDFVAQVEIAKRLAGAAQPALQKASPALQKTSPA